MNNLVHGHDQTTSEAYHHAAMLLGDSLSQATDGEFLTEIHSGGLLGSETQMMEKLISGELTLANITTANAATLIPELSLFSAPYIFSDAAHFTRSMTSRDLKQIIQDKIRTCFPDLECIAYFTPGPRNIYSRTMAIIHPEDLAGLRMRVMASPTEARVWASLGAIPVPLPFAEIENSMKQGEIDAAEDTSAVYATQRHYEIGPYHSLTGHQWSVAMIIANTRLASDISKDLPEALRAAGESISKPAIDIAISDQISQTEALRQIPDVHVIEPDIDAFKAATKQMLEEIAEKTDMQPALSIIQENTVMTEPEGEQAHV